MKAKRILLILSATLFLASCANIAKGLLLPNQCKRCEVYNTFSGNVLTTFEGCGATNVRLEECAKVYAFEQMKSYGNCDINVRCTTWKQDPPTP